MRRGAPTRRTGRPRRQRPLRRRHARPYTARRASGPAGAAAGLDLPPLVSAILAAGPAKLATHAYANYAVPLALKHGLGLHVDCCLGGFLFFILFVLFHVLVLIVLVCSVLAIVVE